MSCHHHQQQRQQLPATTPPPPQKTLHTHTHRQSPTCGRPALEISGKLLARCLRQAGDGVVNVQEAHLRAGASKV
jgi:hypothetical protein